MKLNPLDIRRQQFAKKTFGGYDSDEVDGFLKQLADQWEDALDEIRTAGERLQEAEGKLRHYERVELALQEALETTRETGRRAEAMAEQKARLILDEAEMRARQILQEAERDRHGLRQDLVKLTSRQAEIGARLRGFLLSELEILAQFQGDDPVGFIKLQPAGGAAHDDVHALGATPEPARLDEHVPDAFASDDERFTSAPTDDADAPASDAFADEPAVDPAGAPAAGTDDSTPDDAFAYAAPAPEAPDTTFGASSGLMADDVQATPASAPPTPDASPFDPAAPNAGMPDAPMPAEAPAPFAFDASSLQSSAALAAETPAASPDASPAWPPTLAPEPPRAAWEDEAPAAAPAWDLRSLVTGADDNVAGSEAERERIRRILDDLD